jgi:hypothetical protein
MSDRLMSAADLHLVTGLKRYTKQVAWFRENYGVKVVCSSDGAPVVTWATFEALQAKKAGLGTLAGNIERPVLRPVFPKAVK